jgi:hypothetical protein
MATVSLTEAQAITAVKKAMPLNTAAGNMSDADMLEHFMCVYTAWYEKDELEANKT